VHQVYLNQVEKLTDKFIRDNIKILFSEKNLDSVKKNFHKFYNKHVKPHGGKPKNHELSTATIGYCIKNGIFTDIGGIRIAVDKSEFLKKYIYEKDFESFEKSLAIQKDQESFISIDDLNQLHKKEYLTKKEQELRNKVKEEVEKEIEERFSRREQKLEEKAERIKEEEERLQKFKSRIDRFENIEITEKDIEITDYQQKTLPPDENIIWYKRLGLERNPFPTTDGLSKIPEKFYDEIVLKTETFSKYYAIASQNPEEFLHKSVVICGQFGCGKTTLFDYLKRPLVYNSLLPIHIIVDAEKDVDIIKRNFYTMLFSKLADKYKEIFSIDARNIFHETNKSTLAGIMKAIISNTKYIGFIIFIDGLHKEESYIEQAYKFINGLQNTIDFFIREEIPIGTFIAGSNRWFGELTANPSLIGSRKDLESIPEITVDQAFEMINKRFSAFAQDKDDPPKVKRSEIKNYYLALKSRLPRDITSRDIVDAIMGRLTKSEFDFVYLRAQLSKDILNLIYSELNKHRELSDNFGKLKNILKNHQDKFFLSIQMLVKIYENKFVKENSKIFNSFPMIFGVLFNCGLIQKYEGKKDNFRWGLSKEILDFDNDINTKYSYRLDDYLIKLFVKERHQKPTLMGIESEEATKLNDIIKSNRNWGTKIIIGLEDTIVLHKKILRHKSSEKGIISNDKIIKETTKPLITLLETIFYVTEGKYPDVGGLKNLYEKFSESWLSSPEFIEYFNKIGYIRKNDIQINLIKSAEICVDYERAFKSLTALLDNCIRWNSVMDLSSPDLNLNDKKQLHNFREEFYNREFFSASRLLTDYTENKLRKFLFNILTIKFGNKWRRRLGKEINLYIDNIKEKEEKSRIGGQNFINDLYNCDRTHYKKIILDVKGNWELIFKNTFHPIRENEIREKLTLIFSFSVKDKHNAPESLFKRKEADLLLAAHNVKTLLELIDTSYQKLIDLQNFFVKNNKYYFSFLKLKDENNLNPIILNHDEMKNVVEKLSKNIQNSKPYKLVINDAELIKYEYSCDYRIFIAIICFCLKKKWIKIARWDNSTAFIDSCKHK